MKQEESWEMRAQQVLWQVKTGREMLKWCLSFMLLQQVPHQLEIIDSKSRLAGRLSEPRSWRTGGLRPLSCICKCATAAYPAQGRKQQTLGCKTHLFGFFTGTSECKEQYFWSLVQDCYSRTVKFWILYYAASEAGDTKVLQHGMKL